MKSMSAISDEEKVLWQAIDTRIERDMMRLCAARKEEKTTWVERGERHPSRKTGASLASQIPPILEQLFRGWAWGELCTAATHSAAGPAADALPASLGVAVLRALGHVWTKGPLVAYPRLILAERPPCSPASKTALFRCALLLLNFPYKFVRRPLRPPDTKC